VPEINIDIEYFDHRKTKRLIIRFGEDAAIYPIKIWSYAARHHPIDGLFSGYADEEIAAVMSASSNAISILQAMLDVGFLDRTTAGIAVHGWTKRQGHIVAYHKRAVHAANARWGKLLQNEENNATSNATSTTKHATSNALQEVSLVKQVEQVTQEEKNSAKNFIRPSIQEISEYCKSRGNRIDPQAWLDHYTANGWRVGRNPMKDWKAAIRTWEKNSFGPAAAVSKSENPNLNGNAWAASQIL
jgi:hypothetical protein